LALGVPGGPDRRPDRQAPHPGRDPGGFIITALIGIAGSVLATWAGQNLLHIYGPGESAGLIASVIGAVVLLVLYHAVFKNKSS